MDVKISKTGGHMRHSFCVTVLILLACYAILPVTSGADDSRRPQSSDELLFLEIPSVIAASRREQLATEAPASVEVINADEIKQCGATSILQALSMLPGISLMNINCRNAFVNIRGFSEGGGINNYVLVMIDGRPIEWDVYNVVLWDQQTIGLDEIERIEVVKGPGSSLYGANAYSGVINIITKTPEQINGTEVNAAFGTPRLSETSVIHGWTGNKVDYKISAGFSSEDEYYDTPSNHASEMPSNNAGQVSRVNALIEYKLTDDSKLSFSAGRSYALNDKLSVGAHLGTGYNPMGDTNDYEQVAYKSGSFSIHSVFKNSDMSIIFPSYSPWEFKATSNDTELQDTLFIKGKHSIVWGITSRTIQMKPSVITASDINESLWGVFAEDQYKASDKLDVVLGARYDKNPLTEARVSPRASILYTVETGHVIMFSAAQAYRNPNLLDSYFDAAVALPTLLPASSIVLGNKNLKPESVTSYVAEYRANFSRRINGKLGVFYNLYSDFIITTTDIEYYPANPLLGIPPNTVPKTITSGFANGGQAENLGAEISMNVMLCNWLTGMMNYTYTETKDKDDDPSTLLINETNYIRRDSPRNIVNAALNAKFKNGIYAYLGAQWVDGSVFDYETSSHYSLTNLPAYTLVNARIGYMFMKNTMEASLAVFDLFDVNANEGLPGASVLPQQLPLGEELGRRITAKVSYEF
jgi:iron complex outermembrane recepter protein